MAAWSGCPKRVHYRQFSGDGGPAADTPTDYHVYLLTPDSNIVDESFHFDSAGWRYKVGEGKFGWNVQQASDAVVRDRHADTVLVGWDLAVKDGVMPSPVLSPASSPSVLSPELSPASSPSMPSPALSRRRAQSRSPS